MNHLFDFEVSLQCSSNSVEPTVLANALQIIQEYAWDNAKRPLSEQRSTRSREWRYYACFTFKNEGNLNYEDFIDSVFDRLDVAADLLNSIVHPNGRLDLYTTVYSVEAFAIVLPRDLLRRAGKIGVEWGIEYILLDRKRPSIAG